MAAARTIQFGRIFVIAIKIRLRHHVLFIFRRNLWRRGLRAHDVFGVRLRA